MTDFMILMLGRFYKAMTFDGYIISKSSALWFTDLWIESILQNTKGSFF